MPVQKLQDTGVAVKILGIIVLIMALFTAGIFLIFLPKVEKSYVDAREQALVDIVGPVVNLMKEYQARIDKGEFSAEEGKKRAMERIKHMRYTGNNYFWINDDKLPIPTMIMHPTVPSLDGKVLDDPKFNCATSLKAGAEGATREVKAKNLFQSMVEVCKEGRTGFVGYLWPKPKKEGGVTKELFPKLSYVALFEPWGWIVGTGVYIDDITENINAFRWYIVWFVLGILVLSLAVSLWMALSISRPIERIVTFASAVAGGDLDATLAGTFSGELRTLKGSILDMVGALKAKIQEVDTSCRLAEEETRKANAATREAEEAKIKGEAARRDGMLTAAGKLETVVASLSSASAQLAAQVEESSRGTENQSGRIADTATSMEEMNATVLEVAKNASQAAETADSARTKAQEGAAVVKQVVDEIGVVQKRALELKENMDKLGKQAEGIGQIMNVISDIADQTNLLALNAAIEAARAGEAGRGFAVVADEVRKLAEKTMTATKEVGDAIKGIQNGTRTNILGVEAAAKAVVQATDLATRSGSALEEIVHLVDTASDQVRSIATASEEQSAASEEISRSIEEINRISMETSNAMRQSAQAVEELAHQSQVLKGLVEELQDA